ncbi:uncharacterized protein LOC135120634 [Zophobas morio]|uniref:uncharacterized protein LOC135120634 n=1 Tax=Zophobas morio TaxID=2755281 RepID=UPI003083EC27
MKSTWLLYLSVLGLVLSLIKIFWDWWFLFSNKKRAPLQAHKKVFDPALPFLVSQSAAFIMLGLFIMRMLPFFTPSLAFLAGYLFTHHVDFLLPFALHKHSFLKEKRITCTICFGNNTDQLRERKKERNTNKNTDTLARQRRPNKFRNILLTNKNELQLKRPNLSSFIDKLPALFFILLVIGIFVVLKRAYKVLYVIKLSNHNQRHFSTDDEMLQLMKWINVNADHRLDSITANLVASSQILLHTKVKITIHPHAESSEMRARYRNYYAIYAKVSDYTVYKEIKKLNTTYLVISNCNAHCTSTT